MASKLKLVVEYEDGEVQEVTADQRDFVIFERAEGMDIAAGFTKMPMVVCRFLAYYASKRTGLIDAGLSMAAWDATVIEVNSAAEDVDPTRTAQLRRLAIVLAVETGQSFAEIVTFWSSEDIATAISYLDSKAQAGKPRQHQAIVAT